MLQACSASGRVGAATAGLGATTFVEIGPGRVLAGLAKRTVPDVAILNVSTPDDLAPLTEALAPTGATR